MHKLKVPKSPVLEERRIGIQASAHDMAVESHRPDRGALGKAVLEQRHFDQRRLPHVIGLQICSEIP
jgi:hypothetical protein